MSIAPKGRQALRRVIKKWLVAVQHWIEFEVPFVKQMDIEASAGVNLDRPAPTKADIWNRDVAYKKLCELSDVLLPFIFPYGLPSTQPLRDLMRLPDTRYAQAAIDLVEELREKVRDTLPLDSDGNAIKDPKAPYMAARWFKDEFGIKSGRLRSARKRRAIAVKKTGSVKKPQYQYSVPDAKRLWPHDVLYLPGENN